VVGESGVMGLRAQVRPRRDRGRLRWCL